jgi:geranylgeranyl diphosphate synthase type II
MKLASDKQNAIIRRYQEVTEENRFAPEEKIAAITSVYDALKVKEITQAKMQEYYDRAMHDLTLLQIPPERLTVLREVSRRLMIREV